MNEDAELLRRYAESRSEEAFAEFVRRHLNLVYFAALRRTGDAHLAEDIAQRVFTEVARGAATLARHATLTGWLYTTTRFTAAKAMRDEQRRKTREQEASTMHELSATETTDADWEQLRPVLDAALDELDEREREAVLLRCLEGRAFAEIGATLRLTEAAARMRVGRALDKLQTLLAQRGVTSTGAALAAVLANQVAAAMAPTGLLASVTSVAITGAAAGGATTTAATGVKIFSFMSTTKLTLGVAGVIAIAATAITFQQRQENAALHTEMAALRSQQTSALASLRSENERLVSDIKSHDDTANAEHMELVQLRAARDAFRQRQAAAANRGQAAAPAPAVDATAAASQLKPGMVSVDALQDVGRDTPRAAAQTMMSAAQRGDTEAAANCLTFDPAERAKLEAFLAAMPADQREKFRTPEQLMASVISGSPKPIAGVKLLDEKRPDADTAVQEVQIQYQSGEVRQDEVKFHREADGWKQVVSPTTVDRVIGYFQGKK